MEKKLKYNYSKEKLEQCHSRKCRVCNSGRREDIELDYIHMIPFRCIAGRYKVSKQSIEHHALFFELQKKRDRKAFYWRIVESYDPSEVSTENAIEAMKQLDRIDRMVQDNPAPSNIQVIYKFDAIKQNILEGQPRELVGQPNAEGGDRLPALADPVEVSPEPPKVQAV